MWWWCWPKDIVYLQMDVEPGETGCSLCDDEVEGKAIVCGHCNLIVGHKTCLQAHLKYHRWCPRCRVVT